MSDNDRTASASRKSRCTSLLFKSQVVVMSTAASLAAPVTSRPTVAVSRDVGPSVSIWISSAQSVTLPAMPRRQSAQPQRATDCSAAAPGGCCRYGRRWPDVRERMTEPARRRRWQREGSGQSNCGGRLERATGRSHDRRFGDGVDPGAFGGEDCGRCRDRKQEQTDEG